MMPAMRCFAALIPSEAIRRKIASLQDELRQSQADVRWIGPGELHLTLRFFGELEPGCVLGLRAAFSRIAEAQPSFRLAYAGIGEFPKVVWVGGSAHVQPLAAQIEAASQREGLSPDPHGFQAHLTIGRVRSARGAKELEAAISARRDSPIGIDPVTEFSLVQSTLTPEGPRYVPIETFRLAQA